MRNNSTEINVADKPNLYQGPVNAKTATEDRQTYLCLYVTMETFWQLQS